MPAAVTSLDDAIVRAKAYLEAGADWIFPEALRGPEEFERFAREVEAPLVANMTEFGQSPLLTLDELADMGYAAVLYPVTMHARGDAGGRSGAGRVGRRRHAGKPARPDANAPGVVRLLGYADYEERDRRYFGGQIDEK